MFNEWRLKRLRLKADKLSEKEETMNYLIGKSDDNEGLALAISTDFLKEYVKASVKLMALERKIEALEDKLHVKGEESSY